MSSPKLQYTEIDGTDVSSYVISWQIVRASDNNITEAVVKFNYNVLNVIDFDEDNSFHEIEIYRGVTLGNETCVFRGEVYTFEKDGARVVCNCKCEMYKSVRAEITKTFDIAIDVEAGIVSEMFSTLMEDYAGLNATVGDSVTDSTLYATIKKFICNHADVYERCEKLAEFLDWTFYYDPEDDKVYFEPRGTEVNATTLTVGDNVTNKPVWKYNKTKLVNYYTIVGGEDLVETDDSFSGDGATTAFDLDFTPEAVRVEVGGVLQIGGNETTTTGFDYVVDKENAQIVFESGSIPAVGVGNIIVSYTHFLPRPIIAKNEISVDTHGEYRKTSFITELKDIDDVLEYARQYVRIFKDPFVSTRLEVIDAEDIFPAQFIDVVDSTNNVDTDFFISKVEMFYPYSGDLVHIGDEEVRVKNLGTTMTDRIRRLEEEMGQNQDKITQIFESSTPMSLEKRDFEYQKRTVVTGDVFLLGNSTYGILGTSKLGDSGFSALSTQYLMPGSGVFKEYTYDDKYHDAVNSTATFDDTNNEITFTSGQVWYSNAIAKGTEFAYATLTEGTKTGTLKYEVSIDEKNTWNTVTPNTRTSLTGNYTDPIIVSFDTCDTTSGWGASSQATLSTNTTTFQDQFGTTDVTALNIAKTGALTAIAAGSKTNGSTTDGTGGKLYIAVYVIDSTMLNKLSTSTSTNVSVRMGTNSSNYFRYGFTRASLSVGWTILEFDLDSPTATVGSPDITNLSYHYFTVLSVATSTTWSAGDFIIDSWIITTDADFDKDVYLRVTENATSTASLSTTKNVYGRYTAPTIQVKLEE